jgi:hypothetical protein
MKRCLRKKACIMPCGGSRSAKEGIHNRTGSVWRFWLADRIFTRGRAAGGLVYLNTKTARMNHLPKAVFLFLLVPFIGRAQSVSLTSSNLPIVIINTNGQTILDDPKIEADMGIIDNGPGVRNNIGDPQNGYNGRIGIEIRGHSSQMFPMKSYGLELHDNSGNSVDASLLGMPAESDWVLYAPYTDKTLMRNVLAYTLSAEMGHWAARCRMVEVMLNGSYVGVYVLEEKIKRGKYRVDIAKLKTTDVSGEDVTGGYIFSLDKDPNAWVSRYPAPHQPAGGSNPRFSYVYPKLEDIVPEQAAYIQSYTDSFETALAGNQFMDSLAGYRKYADVNSFMDYFYINEVSRNVDGYRLSSYFNKGKNGKIFAGPVWDYDLAFRNANYCSGSDVSGWAYQFNNVCPDDGAGLVPFWWTRFMEDTAFEAALRCRWKEFRQNVLSEMHIDALIDSINDLVSEAAQRHFQQWPVLGQYVWPNPDPIPGSYAAEISTLKSWIAQRLQWIDQHIPNTGSCSDFDSTSLSGSFEVRLDPNPFVSNPVATVLTKSAQRLSLQVLDAVGRVVYRGQWDLQTGSNSIRIPAGPWPRGVYFFRFLSADGSRVLKKMLKKD